MRIAVFTLLFAMLAGGALAQPAVVQQTTKVEPSIVVTAVKPATPEQARRYVRQIEVTVAGQFARFADPICPMVIGIEAKSARWIENRIREVVDAVGNIRIAKSGCRPNIALAITSDSDGLVRSLRKDFPAAFGGATADILRDARHDGPVHVWGATEVRGRDGERPWVDEAWWPRLNPPIASKVASPNRQVTLHTIVVIDSHAAIGKTLDQLADYVAMRALGGARPPTEASDADSILTLFDPGATPPRELTLYDEAFLEALYSTPANEFAHSQRSAMTSRIVDDTAKASRNP